MHVIRPPPPPTPSTPPLFDTFIYPHLEAISVNPPPPPSTLLVDVMNVCSLN